MTGAPAYAVLRVRGPIKVTRKITDTLSMLRLHRVNHLAVVPSTVTYVGMIKKCEHFITYGEVSAESLAQVLSSRGRLVGDKPLTDGHIEATTPFKTIAEFAQAVVTGNATLKDVPDFKPVFRMHPPKGGLGPTGKKRHVNEGGALGYRGAKINELIMNMI